MQIYLNCRKGILKNGKGSVNTGPPIKIEPGSPMECAVCLHNACAQFRECGQLRRPAPALGPQPPRGVQPPPRAPPPQQGGQQQSGRVSSRWGLVHIFILHDDCILCSLSRLPQGLQRDAHPRPCHRHRQAGLADGPGFNNLYIDVH